MINKDLINRVMGYSKYREGSKMLHQELNPVPHFLHAKGVVLALLKQNNHHSQILFCVKLYKFNSQVKILRLLSIMKVNIPEFNTQTALNSEVNLDKSIINIKLCT